MDFGQWGDPNGGTNNETNKSSASQEQQQQTDQQQQKSASVSTDGPEMMHQFEHAGVFCDICNLTIQGFRYKCLQCPDFDLCSNCERRGHHAGHVMMRIAFPEQAPEAIKRYFENPAGLNEESSAEEDGGVQGPEQGPHGHHHPHHGHGHHGKFRKHPHPHHHGRRHQKKWRKLESDSSDDDTGAAGAAEAIPRVGCPYVMGKKEMKKYAKQMKKMAYLSKKAEKRGGEAGGSDAEKGGKKRPGVDYAQCISQIQQYLNGFGIPIDVVTLYDEWGNGVATTNNQQAGADPNSNNENVTDGASGAQAAGTSDLCDKLQNVRIDIPGTTGDETKTGETARKSGDGECGGDWTMLDNQNEANNQNQTAAAVTSPAPILNTNNLNSDATPSMEPTSLDNGPVKTTWTATAPVETQATSPPMPAPQQPPVSNIQPQPATIPMPWHPVHMRQLPIAPFPPRVPESARPGQFQHPMGPTRPTPPPAHPHGQPTRPAPPPHSTGNPSAPQLYPRIPAFPPLMDFVHGVSNSVGSAIRNVQANLPVPPPVSPTSAPASATGATQGDQLTPQMNATLNALLSMGFSNHDGWLARLVQSKNGDMDAVLSALFDRGD